MTRLVPWLAPGLVVAIVVAASIAIIEDVSTEEAVREGAYTSVYPLSTEYNALAPEVIPGSEIGQTFRSTRPNLSRVEFRLMTYGRVNTRPLVMALFESPSSELPLRSFVAEPGTIVDNFPYVFPFEPIPDSAGKLYLVTITSPESVPGDAFTAFIGECDCYPGGTLFLGGQPEPDRDLTFRVGYENPPDDGILGVVLDRMSQYKPWFFKGTLLALIGLVALALGLVAVGSLSAFILGGEAALRSWRWIPGVAVVILAGSVWLVLAAP